MKKKITKNVNKNISGMVVALVVGAIFIVSLGAYCTYTRLSSYNRSADQSAITPIRELILLAVRGLKKDAPVDPRTGDVYFPEAKLYLPDPRIALPLTYMVSADDTTDSPELSVSTYPVRGTTALYAAQNNKELFEAVPKLQACSRGVKLVHKKFPQSDTQNVLKHTVKLGNGQDMYIYLEKTCPDLNETADLFTNIRAY